MSIRLKILLPVAAGGTLILAAIALGAFPGASSLPERLPLIWSAAACVLLLLIVAAVALEGVVVKPLVRLLRRPTPSAATGSAPIEFGEASGDLSMVEHRIAALETLLTEKQGELDRITQNSRQLRAALQLSEERYVMAVRSANDGLWEWQLGTDEMYFSPRWKSMLGFTEEELQNTRQAWRERILADDLPRVEAALRAHIEGATAHFESQFRAHHKSGETRWLLSRGAAVRHASGKPYRIVGLDTDVTRIKRIEAILNELAEGTSSRYGEEFFQSLVRRFASALKVSCCFVTECANHPTTRLRTLAFWADGVLQGNFEYELPNTPCESVVKDGKVCFLPKDVGKLFPVETGYEGYLGIPIFGSDGRIIGHMAFLDRKQMTEDMLVDSIYRIFTARAGAEMERQWALQALSEKRQAMSM
jgi:PAS domain S-box-containing protein